MLGIPVKIHWTFGYIVLWVIYIAYSENIGLQGGMWYGLFVMVLFACVILHEYGHALTARRFGIRTEDIIMTPLGGIARLQKMPDKPWQELLVAIAGPLVNVVIAGLLILLIYIRPEYGMNGWDGNFFHLYLDPSRFPVALLLVNIGLVLFNLLPIFPMDGGRVLRALLSMRFKKVKATLIAARVGQVLSVGLLILSIYAQSFTLGLISIFIFNAAYMEYRYTKTEEFFKSIPPVELATTDYISLDTDELIQNAKELSRFTRQQILPVLENGRIIGSLRTHEVMQTDADPFEPVATLPMQKVMHVSPGTQAMDIFRFFMENHGDIAVLQGPEQNEPVIDKISFYQFLNDRKIIKIRQA